MNNLELSKHLLRFIYEIQNQITENAITGTAIDMRDYFEHLLRANNLMQDYSRFCKNMAMVCGQIGKINYAGE